MRKFLGFILLLAGLNVAAADVPAPEQLVRNTSKEVLEVIKTEKLSPSDKRFRDLVEAKVLPIFDFNRLTALAVGKYWRQASPEQQAALAREFRTLLVRTYSTAVGANKVQEINVKAVKMADADTDTTVRTEVITASGQPFPIDYRLLKTGNGWKVYDVAVEGVSLVTNYRTSFNQTIQKDGIDGLIKALADRNAAQPAKTSAN
ncbi:MlaC/ttg2D family ABC transporter substrate-binding protein [Chitinimonas taiwanensis]|jgi:phospholipid transport system substrate-binding protein|uniref:Phospholipid transport system substrate-binding protein n=1 Tax=Chitinimonas taiwanensis DSM 18899 TaxID=1121279 RepID=A0A1K2HLM0_9NEIS|nr:ABC transporter substrate-binding protein [Chitinimonas taiwanensis]SFZ77146.1 phospholipid transport system substrate-binding protein [Chitinimonas taiwanensis DSM 18899]